MCDFFCTFAAIMKKIVLMVALAATVLTAQAACRGKYLKLGERVAQSEMVHNPEIWTCDGAEKPKWEHTPTLMARAFVELYEATGDSQYLAHAQQFADQFISPEGVVKTYKQSLYNMDRIQGGNFLILLYGLNPRPEYEKAIETLLGFILLVSEANGLYSFRL